MNARIKYGLKETDKMLLRIEAEEWVLENWECE